MARASDTVARSEQAHGNQCPRGLGHGQNGAIRPPAEFSGLRSAVVELAEFDDGRGVVLPPPFTPADVVGVARENVPAAPAQRPAPLAPRWGGVGQGPPAFAGGMPPEGRRCPDRSPSCTWSPKARGPARTGPCGRCRQPFDAYAPACWRAPVGGNRMRRAPFNAWCKRRPQ
jgi:hypothetical protein